MSPHPDQRFDSVASFFEALQHALMAAGPALAPATQGQSVPATPAQSVPATPAQSAPATPAQSAPATPAQSAPESTSLTQQFFAEGEKLELAPVEPEPGDADEIAAASGRLDRVPRRRVSMIAAVSLALASVAVMGWTVVSLSRVHGSGGPLSMVSRPEVAVSQSQAPAPVPARPRTAVRRARVPSVSAHRGPSRTEPPAAATGPAAPVAAPPAPLAAAPPVPAPLAAPPAPLAAPPAPLAAPPAPAGATPAPSTNEDFTQPWEQTEGESTEAAPTPAEPAPPAPPAAPAAL